MTSTLTVSRSKTGFILTRTVYPQVSVPTFVAFQSVEAPAPVAPAYAVVVFVFACAVELLVASTRHPVKKIYEVTCIKVIDSYTVEVYVVYFKLNATLPL